MERKFLYNGMGINAGAHRGSCSHRWHSASFSGGESRSALMCLRFIPCYKSGGGVNQRKRVGTTYLPTMEVKNVNRCFRHLLNGTHVGVVRLINDKI
jgi:hypothetical protein